VWGIVALAAHAARGSRATGRRGGFKYRTVRVRIPPPLRSVALVQCPFVQPAGRRALVASIVVRIHGGQRCRRARLRSRFHTSGGPGRHRAAAPRARTPTLVERPARGAGCCGFESRRAHACLVTRLLSDNGKHASPVRRQPGFDSPSRLARGCSSVRSEHLPATEKVARSNRVSRSHALVVEVR
jgi:hypothetical protein